MLDGERARALSFDVIGNLDADLSFDPDYLEFLMSKFNEDPRLESRALRSRKMAVTTPPGIALKAKIMLREDVRCFGMNVLRR